MKTYNVGFVGFGFIGKVHAHGYINLPLYYAPVPLKARLTYVCTSRIETARQGAEIIGAEYAVTDYREVTENPQIDIVHICTPNNLHKDALLSAMAHGKHIYCDKPLTATMAEADEVRRGLDTYRGTSQMTLQNRFLPAMMRAKQLVDEGFLGDVLQFRAAYLHSGSADPNAPLKWKLSAEAGGGVIADLASHAIDLAQHLAGAFDDVTATTRIAYPDRLSASEPGTRVRVDAEDAVSILARTASGATGVVEASKIATGAEDELSVEVQGSNGALRFRLMEPHYLDVYDRRAADQPIGGVRGWTRVATGQRYPAPASGFPTPKASIGWMRGHMACLANFLQAVADGSPGDPSLARGVALQHVLDCVHRAAQAGSWVRI